MRFFGFIIIALCLHAQGATWYVRPFVGSYNGGGTPVPTGGVYGSQDGTSYANAWNGLNSVTWGGGGVVAGDTLYVCGAHVLSMTVQNFSLGVLNLVSGVTIRGDYPGDAGTISACAIWAVSSRTNWTGPDANGVYAITNVYNTANPSTQLILEYEIDGTNITRLSQQTTNSWAGQSGAFYYDQPTNFVKTTYGGPPTNNLALGTFGWYFNYAGLSNITFQSIRLHGPVLNNNASAQANHITLNNCTLSDEALPFLMVSNDWWTFSGCDISYAKDGGIYLYNNADSTVGAGHILITNCFIHDVDVQSFSRFSGGDGHGIGVRATANDVTIVNNHLARTASCIEFFGSVQSNVTIAYNFIETTHVAFTDGGGISLTGSGTKTNFFIYGNVLSNIGTNSSQDYHGLGINGGGRAESYVKVWNNTINNANSGLYFAPNTPNNSAFYGQLLNNIIVNPRSHFVYINATGTTNASQIDYNLYYNTNGAAGFTILPSNTPRDSHSIFSSPIFVSGAPSAANDFKLSLGSPAIHAGTAVGIATDFAGVAFANPPSIGAFEFSQITNAIGKATSLHVQNLYTQ